MQRKSGFPVANCSIKMPDSIVTPVESPPPLEEETEQRRQQLINFGHSQWGFNNWNWAVTKQELDFVDAAGNGKYTAGVVAFVSVTVKSFDIQRENIGYATSLSNNKGMAIYKSRKCAVTNALRETLLSFGGSVATELMELLDTQKVDAPSVPNPIPNTTEPENNQNLPNKPVPVEPKNSVVKNIRKEENTTPANCVRPPAIKNAAAVSGPPPVAKAHPIPAPAPAGRVPAPRAAAPPPPRPNSNVSFVLQPVMGALPPGPLYPPRLAPPHVAPPHVFPNYYEYSAGPWHFTYESFDRHHGNVNLNFNIPPKNLVVNSRSGSVECKNACGVRPGPEGEPIQYAPPPQNQGCWIKPTIFYDGFWTEQKVKKWVAEQVEKQFPEDNSNKASSPSNGGQPEPPTSKS
ncbi:uncharacterized protein LOC128677436 isoform X1 [Plodia interpunctella]|uniref:uncharacterized protein LOC128677436 isoform X1 n=1 Tax=Plodia interpunctella TaxID=58824 RepID=UPI0023675483|nr:uncharacterized protein LOC128677436 isoform X1 [Plodia interpunctella]